MGVANVMRTSSLNKYILSSMSATSGKYISYNPSMSAFGYIGVTPSRNT